MDASNPANLERQLRFYKWETSSDDVWFTPTPVSQDSGLGFSYAALRGSTVGCVRWEPAGLGALGVWSAVDLAAIEAIDKVRTDDLKQCRERLAAPSIPQAPGLHGIANSSSMAISAARGIITTVNELR